jgi:hypothetical protein
MRNIVVVTLSVIVVSLTCAAYEPLEIKGDRIGESIAQFTAHYPNAKCDDPKPVLELCSQTQNVSLGEVTTESAACNPPQTSVSSEAVCTGQGVHATFYAGQLRIITYTFAGDFAQSVCATFITKYGKPRDELKGGCSWWEDQDNVHLGAWTRHNQQTAVDLQQTEVELWDSNVITHAKTFDLKEPTQ